MARSAPNTAGNNLAPNVVTLPSSTGFNVGDLVYYKDGDYRALSSADLASATFDVTQSLPTYQQPLGSTVGVRGNGGSSKGQSTAVLTNGNVVTAYIDFSTNYPVFFITTPTGSSVVTATNISTTLNGSSNTAIGVAALSGGGFVVYWLNQTGGTTNLPCYAIYSNAGAVVTAAAQDAGAGQANAAGYIEGIALPNGGFALAYIVQTGTVLSTRAYNSIGTASFGWVTVGSTVVNTSQATSMAARSDSSYIVAYQTNSTTFRYVVYSSAGVSLNTNTFAGTAATAAFNNAPISVSTLSDGTTFVIGYITYTGSSVYYYNFRLLPSSYTLSAETTIPQTNLNPTINTTNSTAPNTVLVKGLAAGGFLFAYNDQTNSIFYAFFSNAGATLSGANLNGAIPFPIPGAHVTSYWAAMSAVEYGGNVNLFWRTGSYNQTSPFIFVSSISTTTYQLISSNFVLENLGTVVSTVNAVAPTTTPGAARFLASASSSQILTNQVGFTVNPSTLAPVAADSIKIAATSNGGFVVVYRRRVAPFSVTAVVYNRFGVITQTIAVGNGDAGSTLRDVGVAILTNGSMVVAFHTATNTVTFYIYTVSGGMYSLNATTTNTEVVVSDANYRFGLTAITNDRFAFAYTSTGSLAKYAVYNASGTLVSGPTTFIGASLIYMSISAFTGGGFSISSRQSSYNTYTVGNYTGNTFSNITNVGYGSATNMETANSIVTPGNIIMSTTGVTASSAFSIVGYDSQQNPAGTLNFSGLTNYEDGTCLGLTGAGSAVVVCFGATTTTGFAKALNAGLAGNSTTPLLSGSSYFVFNTPSISSSTGRGQICSAPGVGYNCIFAWLDANNFPTYAILYAYPSTAVTSITSGVTASALQPITPYSNQTLNGYVLQGVAVTSAPAGGTGQVQTNGIARLNSNYSVSTPASTFDFQTPNGTNIPGVKGTAIGNTVILEGRA